MPGTSLRSVQREYWRNVRWLERKQLDNIPDYMWRRFNILANQAVALGGFLDDCPECETYMAAQKQKENNSNEI